MSQDKKTIAIIRGGISDRYRSMQNGAKVILSLGKHEDKLKVVDVVLDEKNN